jgi:hypothetical protein
LFHKIIPEKTVVESGKGAIKLYASFADCDLRNYLMMGFVWLELIQIDH